MEKQKSELQFKTFAEYWKYEQEQQAFYEKVQSGTFTEDELREEYMKRLGDPIPFYETKGNQVLKEKFNGSFYRVYQYCLEHNKTWEEVLNFKYDETVFY